MKARQGGFALLATVAVLAVLEIAVLGVLLLCLQAESSARDSTDLVRARAGAEAAVRETIVRWDESAMRTAPQRVTRVVPTTGPLSGGVRIQATAEQVRDAVWLLRGVAFAGRLASHGDRAIAKATALLIAIPLPELLADFFAPLVSGGATDLQAGTVIDALQHGLLPPFWSTADCAGTMTAPTVRPAVALGPAASLNNAATLAGMPPVLYGAPRADSLDFERLGTLRWTEIATIADRVETGALSPAPAAQAGACETAAAANWGAPDDPAHPCFDYFPLIYSTGPLRITGGHGQGILTVDGALTLEPGSRFTGVILARSLSADSAEITGSVRVASSARMSARLRYNECAVGRALRRSPALRKLYRVSDRWWLPGFG